MEENMLSLTKEDGTLISKEEFLKAAEETYNSLKEQTESYENLSYLDIISNPDLAIDSDKTLETYEFSERNLYISDEITPELASTIFELIKFWNVVDDKDEVPKDKRNPITIYINTPGGDLEGTLTIIGAIKTSKTPVHTYTMGTGYSGGFFIGISGHKRYGMPYSSYCFHEGSAQDGGDAHKLLQRIEFYKARLKTLKKITIENTKITEADYEAHLKDDWFMDAEEALKFGIIDEIITEI